MQGHTCFLGAGGRQFKSGRPDHTNSLDHNNLAQEKGHRQGGLFRSSVRIGVRVEADGYDRRSLRQVKRRDRSV